MVARSCRNRNLPPRPGRFDGPDLEVPLADGDFPDGQKASIPRPVLGAELFSRFEVDLLGGSVEAPRPDVDARSSHCAVGAEKELGSVWRPDGIGVEVRRKDELA